MIHIEQFIPQDLCLACDTCCRFNLPETIWSPLFTAEEIKELVGNNIIPPLFFTEKKGSRAHRINLEPFREHFICPCFDPKDKKCKIYSSRPFECRLYPFLLVKKENKFYLAYDRKCAYFSNGDKKRIEEYRDYLKNEFQKENSLLFLREHLELFARYPLDDIGIVSCLGL